MEAGSALCRRGGLASRSCPHFEKSSCNVNRTSLGTLVCCCRAKMCSKIGSSLSVCTRLSFTEHSHQTRGSGNSLRPFCPSSRPGMLSFTNRAPLGQEPQTATSDAWTKSKNAPFRCSDRGPLSTALCSAALSVASASYTSC